MNRSLRISSYVMMDPLLQRALLHDSYTSNLGSSTARLVTTRAEQRDEAEADPEIADVEPLPGQTWPDDASQPVRFEKWCSMHLKSDLP